MGRTQPRDPDYRSHGGVFVTPCEVDAYTRAMAGTATQVEVPALNSAEYTRDEWWPYEQGLIAFQNEVIEFFYYRVKYRRANWQ
jgi:hypothetical protein